jgi:la-related protein 6
MSVAVIPVQPTYMEHYFRKPLLSSDSDSDAGYGTPAENIVETIQKQKKINLEKLVVPELVLDSSEGPVEVDADLQEKIVKQVEWYFSDENLLKDSFLMKHITRNKQGYVSLKLVASLRKVKTLSKDWRVVLECLKHSDFLALNEEETKVRRTSPAPQVDFSHIAKTLLITNYHDQEPNLEDVKEHFGKYGDLVQVRLIHPGRAIPLDVKPCKPQHSSLGKELCILLQFKSGTAAKSALKKIIEHLSWRDEMEVHMLEEKKSADQDSKDQEDKSPRKKKKGGDSKGPEVQIQSVKQKGVRHIKDSQIFQRRTSPPSSPDTHRYGKSHRTKASPELSGKYLRPDLRKDYSSDSGMSSCSSRSSSESPKLTPEPTRKFFSGELSWRSADKQHSHMNSGIIRQPLGPDGSRGFAKHRLNPISIAVQSC